MPWQFLNEISIYKFRSELIDISYPIFIVTLTFLTGLYFRFIDENKLPGYILTITFLIDEPNHIPTISLSTDPLILWDDDLGIYENEFKQREIPVQSNISLQKQTLVFLSMPVQD